MSGDVSTAISETSATPNATAKHHTISLDFDDVGPQTVIMCAEREVGSN